MADIARQISLGTAQNQQATQQMGQQLNQGVQQERQAIRDTMQAKKFAMERQMLIDQKGDALFQVLEFKNNQLAKAKAGWEANREPAPPQTLGLIGPDGEVEQPQDRPATEMTAEEKLAYSRYETALGERNQLLESYTEDPRIAALLGEYTYDAESKRQLFASEEVLNSMLPTQRQAYVEKLTALAKARRQMQEQAAGVAHATKVDLIRQKEAAEMEFDPARLQNYTVPTSIALGKNQYAANYAGTDTKNSVVELNWKNDIAEFEPRTQMLKKTTSPNFKKAISGIFSTWEGEGDDVAQFLADVEAVSWDNYAKTETDKKILEKLQGVAAAKDPIRLGAFVNSMRDFMHQPTTQLRPRAIGSM